MSAAAGNPALREWIVKDRKQATKIIGFWISITKIA
jgi:hypothetical protein